MHVARRNQLPYESRVHDCPTTNDAPQRVDELVNVNDPRFQQVAGAFATADQVGRLLDNDVGREDKNRCVWRLGANDPGGAEAFGCKGGRHPDIDNYKIGLQCAYLFDQIRRLTCLAYNLEAPAREKTGDPFAEKHVVVGDHHAHRRRHTGIVARAIATLLATLPADSSDERDELVESFRWSIPLEGLARPLVEECRDGVEVLLGVNRKVGALGEELADEAVPVLVGAPLPG